MTNVHAESLRSAHLQAKTGIFPLVACKCNILCDSSQNIMLFTYIPIVIAIFMDIEDYNVFNC